jgi:hypothetical protein
MIDYILEQIRDPLIDRGYIAGKETTMQIIEGRRGDAIPVETQTTYDHAYHLAAIAGHIQHEGRYTEADLPFPSLLTDQQRKIALEQAQMWQQRLLQLAKP